MSGNMEGKAALVTGASGGIGLATARRFAKAGASVALCARRTELIDEEVERLTAAGFKAFAVPADVSDASQVSAMVARRRALRSTRLRRQQRRGDQRARPGARDSRAGMGPADLDQPDRRLAVHEARTRPHGAAGFRSDRERFLRCRLARGPRSCLRFSQYCKTPANSDIVPTILFPGFQEIRPGCCTVAAHRKGVKPTKYGGRASHA